MTSVMQSLFKPTAATVNWDAGNNLRFWSNVLSSVLCRNGKPMLVSNA